MPKVYLSPSTRAGMHFADGGSEEYYMNLIAEKAQKFLAAGNTACLKSRPQMTEEAVIADSNGSDCDLHLAIQSSTSPENAAYKCTGANIYYYPASERGKRFAGILQRNYQKIYPEPDDVAVIPNETPPQLCKTKAPAVLLEAGYHDNPLNAQWIRENISSIGRAIAKSVAEYLGVALTSI